jgi:hypothetical protein
VPPAANVSLLFADVKGSADGTLDELLGTPTSMLPGLENPGGIWHADIGFVVQGHLTTPDYLNNTTALTGAGATPTSIDVFDEDVVEPHAKGTATVPFTLVLPSTAHLPSTDPYKNLPVIVFQHGLGSSRTSMMGFANALAGAGFALLAIEIPFHGARDATATDAKHNFTGTAGPDGFAEITDQPFVAFFDAAGNKGKGLPGLDPRVVRDAFLQSALDVMQEVRLVTVGDVSAIASRDARLASLSFRHEKVGYAGESFGSMIGGLVNAIEPHIGAAFLDVGGGGLLFPLLLNSWEYGPKIGPFLDGALGTQTGLPDDPDDTDWAYNLAEFLLESGDAAAYAPYIVMHPIGGNAPKHVLQPSAHFDQAVPNQANEHLAHAMGLQPVNLPMGGMIDLQYWPSPPAAQTAPVSGNLMVGGQPVTAAFIQFEQASHGMLDSLNGTHDADLTQPYPYPPINPPVPIVNPTARLGKIFASFMKDYFAGVVPTVAPGQ